MYTKINEENDLASQKENQKPKICLYAFNMNLKLIMITIKYALKLQIF